MGLRKRPLDARHVADTEGYGHAIEAAIRISELFGIALLEGDNAIKAALGRAFLAHGKHIGVDIAHDDARPGTAGLCNPEGDITGATGDRMLGDPLVRAFCSAVMGEAAAIGEKIGCRIAQSAEDRHALTATLGAFKTSMLQDVEAGRAIELDALVSAVREIGGRVGLPTANIDILLGLTRLFGRVRGLYPE